jgi:Maintenance of mitochondrial structure and function/JAB1/Mov34/MPN/PAD-1 ubiquitin protease
MQLRREREAKPKKGKATLLSSSFIVRRGFKIDRMAETASSSSSASSSGLAGGSSSSSAQSEQQSRKIGLHPLAISGICDHYTRVAVGGSKLPRDAPVVGLLFGVQAGSHVSIFDATDIIYEQHSAGSDEITILPAEISKKKELWTAVYTSYELIGWYAVGVEVTAMHMAIHKKMLAFNESPLFVLLNPMAAADTTHLPLSVYEVELKANGDAVTPVFVDVPFSLETSQAERVAIEQVTKQAPVDGTSTLEVQNGGVQTSLRILEDGIDKVIAALQGISAAGDVPVDYALLHKSARLAHLLPTVDSREFDKVFDDEVVDTLMISYLAAATKTTVDMSELVEMYTTAFRKR